MKKTNTKLIILDRDGVINLDSAEYIKSVAEWIPIDSSLTAIQQLKKAGYLVAVATNQSGVARGYFSIATLDAMHQKMHQLLADRNAHIDALAYCPHLSEMTCLCRKPKSGMLINLLDHFNLSPNQAILVGDSMRDIESAQNIGMDAVLVRTGKPLLQKTHSVPIFDDLLSFAKELL